MKSCTIMLSLSLYVDKIEFWLPWQILNIEQGLKDGQKVEMNASCLVMLAVQR